MKLVLYYIVSCGTVQSGMVGYDRVRWGSVRYGTVSFPLISCVNNTYLACFDGGSFPLMVQVIHL